MRVQIPSAKATMRKTRIIVSQPRGNHNVLSLMSHVQDKTQAARGRWIAPSTLCGDVITRAHKILKVENESRCGHKKAMIIQGDFTNWMQSSPIKSKETWETMSCSQRKSQRICTDTSKEFNKQCQDQQWHHDKHPSSLRNERMTERCVQRVKEGTAIAAVQSGVPEEWWDRAGPISLDKKRCKHNTRHRVACGRRLVR